MRRRSRLGPVLRRHVPSYVRYKLDPLDVSTCGDYKYSSSIQKMVRDPGKTKAALRDDNLDASDLAKLGIKARGTGTVRRRLSIVLQQVLTYRTPRYVCSTPGEQGKYGRHSKVTPPTLSSPLGSDEISAYVLGLIVA